MCTDIEHALGMYIYMYMSLVVGCLWVDRRQFRFPPFLNGPDTSGGTTAGAAVMPTGIVPSIATSGGGGGGAPIILKKITNVCTWIWNRE